MKIFFITPKRYITSHGVDIRYRNLMIEARLQDGETEGALWPDHVPAQVWVRSHDWQVIAPLDFPKSEFARRLETVSKNRVMRWMGANKSFLLGLTALGYTILHNRGILAHRTN